MKRIWRTGCALALTLAATIPAQAYELAIGNYGSAVDAWPFAVAMEGGFFKKDGVDVSAIRNSTGGSTDVRNMLAGDLPYSQTAIAPVLSAVQQGADLVIINEGVHSSATGQWITPLNSPVHTLADVKGKRIGMTTPQGTTDIINRMMLQKAGLTASDVSLVAAGSFGAELTLLDNGGLDIAPVNEPIYSQNKAKYRILESFAQGLPPMTANVGITSRKVAQEHPDLLRGIIKAHRDAVAYMHDHPAESAQLIDKVYKIGPDLVRSILDEIFAHRDTNGVPFFGQGEFNAVAMDNAIAGLKLVGTTGFDPDWRKLVDQEFLPPDLQTKLQDVSR